ncbi:sigma 54-interacting transcriptional regulator [Candidatus Hydrogenedentota bacterium]
MSSANRRPKVKGEVSELSLLFEISQTLDRNLALTEVGDPILKEIIDHMGMVRGSLLLLNRETGEIMIEAARGLSHSQKRKGTYRPGEGITGKVVQTGRRTIIPKISEEPHFLDRTGARKNSGEKELSFVCVPIKLDNEVIGALSVDSIHDENTSLEDNARVLSIIASMIAQAVRLRQTVREERERLLEENTRLTAALRARFRPSNIIGNSNEMQDVYDHIAQVAPSDTSVMIRGESGTGKELVAHAVHYNSPRADRPFVKVNCAALPEAILESELFGHERGAFTGAIARRKGRFELAEGGTIFLDEVGDFSPATQVKLLRVLQERQFERVGGTETLNADVRIVAATNRDLEELMKQEEFRHDLYYRLNVFPIHIPPLRERKTDILLLANRFVEKYSKTIKRISTPAIDMLMAYHWPGNVRELENCIERAVLLSNDDVIHGNHLPPTLQTAEASGTVHSGTLQEALEHLEEELILDALKSTRGNMTKAARELGITERIMGLRVHKYGVKVNRFRAR